MKKLKVFYLFLIIVPLVLAALLYGGVFSRSCMSPSDGMQNYVLNLLSVVLSLSSIYCCLKLLKFRKIETAILQTDETSARHEYVKWNKYRLVVLSIVILFCLFVYYYTKEETGCYCALITWIAAFFCYPSENKFQDIRQPEGKKE